jgi:hypothetical protein
MAISFSKEGIDVSSIGQELGKGLKNIYQGKTPEEIKKLKDEQARKDAKRIQDEKDKKDTKPVSEPRNSEGYTAAEEKDYMKKMAENEARVKKMDEESYKSNAGRLAEAAKKVKIKVRN